MNTEQTPETRFDDTAERAVLGGLVAHQCVAIVGSMLVATDFYNTNHAAIFLAAKAVGSRGERVDEVSLAAELRRAKKLNAVGGDAALAELIHYAGHDIPTVEQHARLVADFALARNLSRAALKVSFIAHDPGLSASELATSATKLIADAVTRRDERAAVTLGDGLTSMFSGLEARAGTSVPAEGIPTGLTALDRYVVGGMRPGAFVVVAGRPAMGKSAFEMLLAITCARSGRRVLVLSLEMTTAEVVNRTACTEARLNNSRLMEGALTDEEFAQLAEAANNIYGLPIAFNDQAGLTFDQLRAGIMREHARSPLGMVIIDHLQIVKLVPSRGRDQTKADMMADVTSGLKQLAKDLGIVVVGLSQLNRKVEERDNKRPKLSDLRESGAIEQDTDLVLGLYRDEYYHPDTDQPGIVEIEVLKQRNGPTGVARVGFEGPCTRFYDLPEQSAEVVDFRAPAWTKPAKKGRGKSRDEQSREEDEAAGGDW